MHGSMTIIVLVVNIVETAPNWMTKLAYLAYLPIVDTTSRLQFGKLYSSDK